MALAYDRNTGKYVPRSYLAWPQRILHLLAAPAFWIVRVFQLKKK